jgi:ornithine carbamoyltransferase
MDIISADQLSAKQINDIFQIADSIAKNKEELAIKEHTTLALFFQEPSTRTRTSFEVAMVHLGGHAVYLGASETQFRRGESISDIAKVLSGYCDMIAARLSHHADILEMAESATVPMINALTDLEHPTQALADLYTIRAAKGSIKGRRIAFVGDIATNTANSLMVMAAKMGAEMSLVGPKECSPSAVHLTKAKEYGEVSVSNSMSEGLANADIIYTDTFVSLGKESEAEERYRIFAPYQVNSEALAYAKEDVQVMHCMPAFRGKEITAEVIDGPKSIVLQQSNNKLLLNKAIIIYLLKQD